MIKKFLDFVHSDDGLRLAGVVMTVCLVVENVTTPGTALNVTAGKLLQAGVLLGITSSRGKAKAATPDPKP